MKHLISRLLVVACFIMAVDAFGRAKKTLADRDASESPSDDIPGVPFLVETIGKEMYAVVNRKKYKFFLYMTVGKLPDEATSIVFLNYVCNLLYGLAILTGFLVLPRGPMLIATILTIFTGPALVLVLLACLLGALVAFALYPVLSVLSLWVFFFSTSRLAQVLGRRLGLDHDGDGDVDILDLLSYAASTEWGKMIGMPAIHKMLNDSSMDPFQELHRRLDEIQKSTREIKVNGSTLSSSHEKMS